MRKGTTRPPCPRRGRPWPSVDCNWIGRPRFNQNASSGFFRNLLRPSLDALLTVSFAAGGDPTDTYEAVLAWKGATFSRQRWMRPRDEHLESNTSDAQMFDELRVQVARARQLL